jgi:arabinogalactan endo-1,4-beta-galactosidase
LEGSLPFLINLYMRTLLLLSALTFLFACTCKKSGPEDEERKVFYNHTEFSMGADLSYVNQIIDRGGVYRDSGGIEDPYSIFSKYGANTVRFRLFHNPAWTSTVYDPPLDFMYNDFEDTQNGILTARAQGMAISLDFHYSDTWADPQKQITPAAWDGLDIDLLCDSVYNYTFKTLSRLNASGAMPEYVQVGNEINPGFMLPSGDRWNKQDDFIKLLNSAIKGVRDVTANSQIKSKIIVHVAQPENAMLWFEGMEAAGMADFDIVGLSYYYIWSDVEIDMVSNYIDNIRKKTGKEVMIVETAYPWTLANADSYGNIIEPDKLDPAFPATEEGQYNYLVRLVQEVIDGGGSGVHYWEPAWITSPMKDLWGTGSAWDCNTLFDFEGNVIKGMEFMTFPYKFR